MSTSDSIEQRNGGYYVSGTAVSLDSVVACFLDGDSPETIQQNLSALTLQKIYGAIAFYLANQSEVDQNIRQGEREIRSVVPPLNERNPEAYARLMRLREQMPSHL
jgi:uncharacterized protein (DUF433 family)